MPSDNRERKPIVPPLSVDENGAINPSSPTSGTEGYGMSEDEAPDFTRQPAASNPGAQGAGDVRKTSYPMPEGSIHMENKDVGNNPSKGKQFRCSEVGPASCNWSVTGSSEQEILPKIEQHGREAHGINKMDDSMKKRVHEAIHDRAA